MHLTQLAALVDPATPAHTLAQIAANTSKDDRDVRAHLLVHANTPNDVTASFGTDLRLAAGHALSSPAATPATQVRLLRAMHHLELREHLREYRCVPTSSSRHPLLVDELSRRAQGTTSEEVAMATYDVPGIDDDTRAHVMHTLLDGETMPTFVHATFAGQFTLAALSMPAHLAALTEHAQRAAAAAHMHAAARLGRARDEHPSQTSFADTIAALTSMGRNSVRPTETPAAVTIAANLSRLGREPDPRDAYVQHIRDTHAADPRTMVSLCPDADLAQHLMAAYPSNNLAWVITNTVTLHGTDVWKAAAFYSQTRTTPPAALPDDLALAIALHAPAFATQALFEASAQRLDANSDTLAALTNAVVTAARQPAATGLLTMALLRLFTHPSTPASARENARVTLRAARKKVPAAQAAAPLLNRIGPLEDIVNDTPLHTLTHAASGDATLTALHGLAQHIAPTLRPLWADPTQARTALGLGPGFTGTVHDLIAATQAIAAT